jgi:hypothetical protein
MSEKSSNFAAHYEKNSDFYRMFVLMLECSSKPAQCQAGEEIGIFTREITPLSYSAST